jgi:hypothetical protein
MQPRAPVPFHQLLHEAIRDSGLTLQALQRSLADAGLPVGRSTLSYWQNGRRIPTGSASLAAVARLEQLLHVRDGALVAALRDPASTTVLPHFDLASTGPEVDRLMDQVGCRAEFTASEGIAYISTGVYGVDGELVSMRSMIAIRALADIDRVPFIHAGEAGGDPRLLHYEILGGGRAGRACFDLECNVVVGEIIFDRQVRRGECHLIQYEVRDGNRQRADCYFKMLNTARAFMALEVAFHPECLPVLVEEYERLVATGPDIVSRNRMLASDRTVSVVRERARRGVVGLRWSFP